MSDSVGGGIQNAVDRAQRAICGAACGIGEVRAAIRAQPITAALVVFALGYLFGSVIPSRRS
jgi:hypothetical protein